MADAGEDPTIFTAHSLPSDPRLWATVTNAYLGTRVYHDTLHVSGVYNGALGDTHRAILPSPLGVQLEAPAGTEEQLTTTFVLDTNTGSHCLPPPRVPVSGGRGGGPRNTILASPDSGCPAQRKVPRGCLESLAEGEGPALAGGRGARAAGASSTGSGAPGGLTSRRGAQSQGREASSSVTGRLPLAGWCDGRPSPPGRLLSAHPGGRPLPGLPAPLRPPPAASRAGLQRGHCPPGPGQPARHRAAALCLLPGEPGLGPASGA